MKKNKLLIIGGAVILLIVLAIIIILVSKTPKTNLPPPVVVPQERLFEEAYTIPSTQEIFKTDANSVASGPVNVPLSAAIGGEKTAVPGAILTIKGAYDLAAGEAKKWDSAAKLSFIKSFGAITLEGRSSQWQAVFSAEEKAGKAYEIIIQKDKIVSQKEIVSSSDAAGIDLPAGWPDSGEFIRQLQNNPNFSQATINSFLLASTPESDDAKWWFSLGTSQGVVTFEVK
ncbi:MAG: hypothetical protein PHE24_00735 [Patescibacteria group bacterium]|nr:hypothetical protein [Patescibacteria group bacterium]